MSDSPFLGSQPAREPADDPLELALAVAFGPAPTLSGPISRFATASRLNTPIALRDPDEEASSEPLYKPMPAPRLSQSPDAAGLERYRFDGELARGGMGAVLRGRDLTLGRDIAAKVLLEAHAQNPAMVQRFVEEAQIGGQLQHPGLVPVYELGQLDDGRPFFTMKLVKGRTLAALLAEHFHGREMPAADVPRFLAIFEDVCQTLAYAHARGVVHRDLKPANIMVGAFGEVQVMDWGLAKILASGEPESRESAATPATAGNSTIRTLRCDTDNIASQAGLVLGTPAYMAPEQARGDIDHIDERTDVFGLGAILCEILTGEPPYAGRHADAVRRAAANADLAEALTRLNACPADVELIQLVRRCLAANPQDRPADAGVVRDALSAYRASNDQRRRAAELASVEARAKAEIERKRRWWAMLAAASTVACVLLAVGGWLWMARERQAQFAKNWTQVNDALSQAVDLHAQGKLAGPEGQQLWERARAMARKADALVDPALTEKPLAARVGQFLLMLEREEQDRRLVDRLEEIRLRQTEINPKEGRYAQELALPEYLAAFEAYGVHVGTDPVSVANLLRHRPAAVREAIIAAMEQWYNIAYHFKAPELDWLYFTILRVDNDPWRRKYRMAEGLRDKRPNPQELVQLTRELDVATQSPGILALVGGRLVTEKEPQAAIDLLLRAHAVYAGDFWINHQLAFAYSRLAEPNYEQAVRYYTACVALRPEAAGVYLNLGSALLGQNRPEEALAALQKAKSLNKEVTKVHIREGITLVRMGRLKEAIRAYRTAVQSQPSYAPAHYFLAEGLRSDGQLAEAIAEYETAVRLKPDYAEALSDLGALYYQQRRFDEAAALLERAIRNEPDLSQAQANLGGLYLMTGYATKSLPYLKRALELDPQSPVNHNNLGIAYWKLRRFEEAIQASEAAIAIDPGFADALCNIGHCKQQLGDYAGALAALRRGHEIGSRDPNWSYPSAEWVHKAERLENLSRRLPAILAGDDTPAGFDEHLELARICCDQRHYAAAARLFHEAFAAHPDRADLPPPSGRFDAACAAALAGTGQGNDAATQDDAARSRWRNQALRWFQAELAWRREAIDSHEPAARAEAQRDLRFWQEIPELAPLRDAREREKLPEEERGPWQDFWGEVEAALTNTGSGRSEPRESKSAMMLAAR